MKQVYVNRLAILDTKESTRFYEISTNRGFQFYIESDQADEDSFKEISDIISETYLTSLSHNNPIIVKVPIEKLSINKILTLPKDMVYIEVVLPKSIKVNTIKKLKLLQEKGYTLVLDHFKRKSKLAFHLMPYCDILKINKNEFDEKEFDTVTKFLVGKNKKIMATSVNSIEERDVLQKYPIDYFSGDFFCKPKLITNKKLGSFKPNSLQLLKLITKSPMDFEELASLVSKDIVFTYKLMKYVNSAYFAKEKNISDVKQAITYLGEKEIKKWAFIILSSSLGEDKPDELMIKALTKARFCEQIAIKIDDVDSTKAFMMGLFSYIDTLADVSFDIFAEEISMDNEIYKAIKDNEGVLGRIFNIANIYDTCRWDVLSDVIEKENLQHLNLSKYYFETVDWVNQIMA